MEINIDDHGRDRLKERVGVSPSKMARFVEKAYASREPLPKWANQKLKQKRPKGTFFKTMMGYLFVFREVNGRVMFITVLPRRGGSDAWWKIKFSKTDLNHEI